MKVKTMDVKGLSHEPLTDEQKMIGRERHELLIALMQSPAYEIVQETLAGICERHAADALECLRNGDGNGATYRAGVAAGMKFALDLPQRLLSDS